MSEIKGQLLGIILTLMVFAAVSVTVASLYNSTAEKVTTYGTNVESGAAAEMGQNSAGTPVDNDGGIAAPGNVAYPALHY